MLSTQNNYLICLIRDSFGGRKGTELIDIPIFYIWTFKMGGNLIVNVD